MDLTKFEIDLLRGILSTMGTFIFFYYLNKHGLKEQLKNMRSDGLTDKEIIEIVGRDEFEKMKKA